MAKLDKLGVILLRISWRFQNHQDQLERPPALAGKWPKPPRLLEITRRLQLASLTVRRRNFSREVSGSSSSSWSGACTATGLGRQRNGTVVDEWDSEQRERDKHTGFLFFFYVLAHGKRASQTLIGLCFQIIQMIILFILNFNFALKRYHGHHEKYKKNASFLKFFAKLIFFF